MGCQPVAFLSSGSEAPAGPRSCARIFAVLVPRRAAAGGLLGIFGFLAAEGAVVACVRSMYKLTDFTAGDKIPRPDRPELVVLPQQLNR